VTKQTPIQSWDDIASSLQYRNRRFTERILQCIPLAILHTVTKMHHAILLYFHTETINSSLAVI